MSDDEHTSTQDRVRVRMHPDTEPFGRVHFLTDEGKEVELPGVTGVSFDANESPRCNVAVHACNVDLTVIPSDVMINATAEAELVWELRKGTARLLQLLEEIKAKTGCELTRKIIERAENE